MTSHPKSGWRLTVGPQWSSVKRTGPGSSPAPGMQQGFHSSYLNAISSSNTNSSTQQQQQQQRLQSTTSVKDSDSDSSPTNRLIEHQRALQQFHENQRQQQLYLEQLELMQRLQAMPGSTTRPWYPTFGPAITTSCTDSTIQLDNPNQFTLINNSKFNRHAVGPHWRSIQNTTAYSPKPSPPSSSPHSQTPIVSSPSSTSNNNISTTAALHAYLSANYSSPASIDHARATSFHQQDQEMNAITSEDQDGQLPYSSQHPTAQRQYYLSHSYPHDPRHHLLLNSTQPSSSREARETLPLTNRASPVHASIPSFLSSSSSLCSKPSQLSYSTQLPQPRQNSKRKAVWDDDDEDEDEGVNESNGGANHNDDKNDEGMHGQTPVQYFIPVAMATGQGSQLQSTSIAHQYQDFDQEMDSTESSSPIVMDTTISTTVTTTTLGTEQDDMGIMTIGASGSSNEVQKSSNPKRSKQRLTQHVYDSKGEQVQDLMKECFFNAAASSR